MNQIDSAHVQAALVAQSGALSALFMTHPQPERLQQAFVEQMALLAQALEATGAPKEFWSVLQMQTEGLAASLINKGRAQAAPLASQEPVPRTTMR